MAVLLKKFLAHIPGTHRIICGEVDGTFPHHHPDPSNPRNLEMLSRSVIQEKADAGIAFDGDGDRLGLVDELGRVVTGDQLLTIFARDYLTRHPGEAVMSEVKASAVLYREISEGGGVPVMWKVGHAYQKEKMKQDGIGLAGETSGHIFFGENYGFDDGLFSAVKLLSIVSRQSLTLSGIIETIPKIYSTGELRLALDSEERKRMLQHITRSLETDGRELITIDGIRVSCGRGYWMLRSSNTLPHITIYCESETAEGLKQCKAEMVSLVTKAGVDFDSVLVKA